MHDKNDPMGLIQEDPELFVRPKLDDGKQKSFLHMGVRTTEEVTSEVLRFIDYMGMCRPVRYGFWGSPSFFRLSFLPFLALCSRCDPYK